MYRATQNIEFAGPPGHVHVPVAQLRNKFNYCFVYSIIYLWYFKWHSDAQPTYDRDWFQGRPPRMSAIHQAQSVAITKKLKKQHSRREAGRSTTASLPGSIGWITTWLDRGAHDHFGGVGVLLWCRGGDAVVRKWEYACLTMDSGPWLFAILIPQHLVRDLQAYLSFFFTNPIDEFYDKILRIWFPLSAQWHHKSIVIKKTVYLVERCVIIDVNVPASWIRCSSSGYLSCSEAVNQVLKSKSHVTRNA